MSRFLARNPEQAPFPCGRLGGGPTASGEEVLTATPTLVDGKHPEQDLAPAKGLGTGKQTTATPRAGRSPEGPSALRVHHRRYAVRTRIRHLRSRRWMIRAPWRPRTGFPPMIGTPSRTMRSSSSRGNPRSRPCGSGRSWQAFQTTQPECAQEAGVELRTPPLVPPFPTARGS